MNNTEKLRKIIMDEIFDQEQALLALSHLENIKTEIELSRVRVTDREDMLQDSLVELGVDYDQAMDIMSDLANVVDHLDPEHPVMQKYFAYMCK